MFVTSYVLAKQDLKTPPVLHIHKKKFKKIKNSGNFKSWTRMLNKDEKLKKTTFEFILDYIQCLVGVSTLEYICATPQSHKHNTLLPAGH